MKKVGIIALIAILVMAMTFVLVACDGAGGKGHDEILAAADYADVYVAKNKTGYNLINAKGKALLKQDYDNVELIDEFVVHAFNHDNSADKYFDLSGKEFNLAVAGLKISSINVLSNIEKLTVDGKVVTSIKSPQAILVEHTNKLSGTQFTSVYKFDGTLLATNTDKKALDTEDRRLSLNVIYKFIEDTTYADNTTQYTKKLNCISFTETYKVKFPTEGEGSSLDYKTDVRVWNGNFAEVFNKSFDTSLFEYSYDDDYMAVILNYTDTNVAGSAGNEKATVITLADGKTKDFDVYIAGDDGTSAVFNSIEYKKDLVIFRSGELTNAGRAITLYIPSSQKTIIVEGAVVAEHGDYIRVMSFDADNVAVHALYNRKTLELAKSGIKRFSEKDAYTFELDGKLYNAKLQLLTNSAEEYLYYNICFQDGSDTYFIATRADGSADYYKNDKILLSATVDEEMSQGARQIITIANKATRESQSYNMYDISIVYAKYTLSSSQSHSNLLARQYTVVRGMDKDGNITNVTLVAFGQAFDFAVPSNVTDFNETIDFKNNYATLTVSYKLPGDKLFTVIDRVFMANVASYGVGKITLSLLQEQTIKSSRSLVFTSISVVGNKLAVTATWDDTTNAQGIANKYKTTVYKINSNADGRTINVAKSSEIDKNVEIMGNYLVGKNIPTDSSFSHIFTMDGKKIVNGEFSVENIVGDLAEYSVNGRSFGILKLTNTGYKVLEDAKYLNVSIVDANYYMFLTYNKDMLPQATLKDAKGKTIINKAYGLDVSGSNSIEGLSVVEGKINLKIAYQTKPGGKFYYKSLGRALTAEANIT